MIGPQGHRSPVKLSTTEENITMLIRCGQMTRLKKTLHTVYTSVHRQLGPEPEPEFESM